MTIWHFFWNTVKAYLGWLFFLAVFILVAGFTGGFRAYMPWISFFYGSIAVYILIIVIGLLMGDYKEK